MQQVTQNIRSGELALEDVPAPAVAAGEILIANRSSLVSAGTEKMVMDLAKKSLLGKARERPDHVRRVLEKVRNEGLLNTVQQVRKKLDEPMTMGYSSAGVVLACGEGVQEFKPGDRVASNGPHAEVVSVPRNLCARVPESVSLEHASFGVLGSIAMQGVRLAKCTLGETVLVIGLGLVGQLTVAIARAAGLRVIGTDLDAGKCELALKMGAEVARPGIKAAEVEEITGGLGADAVLITASTKSNGPIELAAGGVRQKGRVVLVGVVGLELDRRPFYFKEAEFVVSCSYGPGRYDPEYEERGHDYPPAYVRWTEQRNIQAVLELMDRGSLDVSPLISHRFSIEKATEAYELIEKGEEPYLGIVIEYPGVGKGEVAAPVTTAIRLRPAKPASGRLRAGILGAGNFARMVLLPAIEKSGKFDIATICSAKGLSATHAAKGAGAEAACSDEEEIFGDESIDAVFSITRHDQHARHVIRALETGKHVFVEKPLCLTIEELLKIDSLVASGVEAELNQPLPAEPQRGMGGPAPQIMVGFNRRFSPAARQVREFYAGVNGPITVSVRFNAGEIPSDHWTQHDLEGGGRIIGEACHAIDLATYLTGSLPVRVYAESVAIAEPGAISDDQCFITLRHANGSISNIGYLAGGDKAFPKERVEVIGGGQVAVIDDFKSVTTCRGGKTQVTKGAQRKGHAEEILAWAEMLAGGEQAMSWEEIRAVSLASILAVRSLREGMALKVG